MVNTLVSSDYDLLEQDTFEPLPDNWAPLPWKRTMGTKVLRPGITPNSSQRLYAQCMKDAKGDATLLALNIDAHAGLVLDLPGMQRYIRCPHPTRSAGSSC